MTSRAALLALVAALAVAAAGCGRSSETPDTFVVGAVEDAAKSGHRRRQDAARAAGGVPRHRAERRLDAAARGAAGSGARRAREGRRSQPRPTGSGRSSPCTRSAASTPTTPAARAQFAAYAASIPRLLPGVRDVIVGNEPNLNLFWLPQFGPDGSDAAAASYLALLAASYDALKDVSPDINVIGGSLSARGSDDPAGSRPTHSPTRFIEDLGTEYRASGRDTPVMDMFSIHPYPENSSIPPDFEHPQSTVDRPGRLRQARGSPRLGLRRHRPAGLLAPDRLRRVRPPDSRSRQQKLGRYTGAEQATTKPIDEQAQADPIRRRDRDRGLPPDGADAALLPRLGRAAARAAPDRRLLRRRHAEIEPGDDRARSPRRPGAAPGVPVRKTGGVTA